MTSQHAPASAAVPSPEDAIAAAWPFVSAVGAVPRAIQRLVIKLGSNVLSTREGTLDAARIAVVASQVASLRAQGTQVLIVTSGAVAAGMGVAGLRQRPTELPRLQALAAIGQSFLMSTWSDAFRRHATTVAQVLLTRSDLEDRRRYLNIQDTLETLLGMGAVPIINENDTVITEELTIGDNDMLSAAIAAESKAELLVIMTDIEGFFTGNPKSDPTAALIPVVRSVTPDLVALAGGAGSNVGRGGMLTKMRAAQHANSFGIVAVIGDGRRDTLLGDVAAGRFRGTLFLPRAGARITGKQRAHWISMRRPKGVLVVDDGARRALIEKGSSLLPVGIVEVRGAFDRGDTVSIHTKDDQEIARGIVSFSSDDVTRARGKKGPQLFDALGPRSTAPEVIHRNNLHLKG